MTCRATVSPVLSPRGHVTPLTPVKPMLSPKSLSPRSPTHYPLAKPALTSPAIAHPPAPATTAQDLLNDVMGFSTASRTIGGGLLPPSSESTAPQPKFLFGSELSHRPSQSIWSASRDEQPLMYPGNGNSPNAPGGGSNGGHIYQTSPRQYSAPLGSQDLSQQSIWSSYTTQSPNSQQNLVGALPSAPFAQPPQPMLVGGQSQLHQRVPSSSVAAQLFPTHNQVQHDPFAYSTPLQPPIHRPEHTMASPLNSPLMHSSLGGSGGPTQYYASSPSAYHSRQLSMHDPRVVPQNYMSQIWSHTG
jgi:protein SMG7